MSHVSGDDQRRYAQAHASAAPADIYGPDGAASGRYFIDRYETSRPGLQQQSSAGATETAAAASADSGVTPSTDSE